MPKRRVCFVTGTRAEFGLMVRTLRAIRAHPQLELQIVVTGMHLDRVRGLSVREIEREGFKVDEVVGWGGGETRRQRDKGTRGKGSAFGVRGSGLGVETGYAMGGIARALDRLGSEVVLVVGDRVEAFAAAAAGHLSGRVVAHVHGGDRALGQVDDALRHAITKLAHVHSPATKQSAERVRRLGEQGWRIHRVGSPGVEGIVSDACSRGELCEWMSLNVGRLKLNVERSSEARRTSNVQPPTFNVQRGKYALLVLHPADGDEGVEYRRAGTVLRGVLGGGVGGVVVVYPNNDPGSGGIVRYWEELERVRGSGFRAQGSGFRGQEADERVVFLRNVPRGVFLGLMREAGVMVGNSSSGIIEAGSFGTPVLDVGPRQKGRERGGNVRHVGYRVGEIREGVGAALRTGAKRRGNVYGGSRVGERIAEVVAGLRIDERLLRKMIDY